MLTFIVVTPLVLAADSSPFFEEDISLLPDKYRLWGRMLPIYQCRSIVVLEERGMVDQETFYCQVCGKKKIRDEVEPAGSIPASITGVIRKAYPEWSQQGYICSTDLNHFRTQYIREILEEERSELSFLEENITRSMKDHELTAKNINVEFDRQLSFGDRVSDRIADFAGSWTFIAVFTGILLAWIGINTAVYMLRPFDPYPFILLNLVLSAIAAIQAPVIIMSQNRQEERDRMNAEHDYQVNLNAEMEIHQLHRKIDHLLINQGERLLEIQKIQAELMEDLAKKT